MNKKYYLIILVILVILNVFSWRIWWIYPPGKQPVLSQLMEKDKGRRNGGGMRFLEDRLNLDEIQKQEFKQLRKEYFAEINGINEQIDALRKELMNHLMKEDVSLKKDSIFKLMTHHKMKFEKATFKHFNKMRTLCNDEQKEVYDTLFVHMMNRKGNIDHELLRNRHK